MLELPESYVISKQLKDTIHGKTIKQVITNRSPHRFAFYSGEPEYYSKLLNGKQITNVEAIAGQVELSAGNSKLVLNDGVNIRYLNKGEDLPKKHQLWMEFEDESSLVCTVQMYGGLWAFLEGENDNFYYLVAKERPSPLTDGFNLEYYYSLFLEVKATVSMKAFLATQQHIPGLGNGVLQDILFSARLNPKSKLGALSEEEKVQLFYSVKQTLFDMAQMGGRDTEKDLFGKSGGYQTILSNKTWKNPCPVCGDTIVRQAYLGGNVYFCPTCQPLKT